MDDSAKGFVERLNIAHYIDQLITETDPVKRNMLVKLLAEEVAKQVNPSARQLERDTGFRRAR
jgi:predicted phosphatase